MPAHFGGRAAQLDHGRFAVVKVSGPDANEWDVFFIDLLGEALVLAGLDLLGLGFGGQESDALAVRRPAIALNVGRMAYNLLGLAAAHGNDVKGAGRIAVALGKE